MSKDLWIRAELDDLIMHPDKTQLIIPGLYRDHRDINWQVMGISEQIKSRLHGMKKDHSTSHFREETDDIGRLFRRFKKITYEYGLVEMFYERDYRRVPGPVCVCGIRITSNDKLDYSHHMVAQLVVDEVLNSFGIRFHLYLAEIAIDTLNESKGKALRKFLVPKHWKPEERLRFLEEPITGRKISEKDFNRDGKDQYYNFRKDRRQWHLYERETDRGTLYRVEFTTRYEHLKRKGITDHKGLHNNQKKLLRDSAGLKIAKLKRILTDHSRFKKQEEQPFFTINPFEHYESLMDWPTTRMINELCNTLQMEKAEIMRKYFDPLEWPNLAVLTI